MKALNAKLSLISKRWYYIFAIKNIDSFEW
jgi:hypothetical protein